MENKKMTTPIVSVGADTEQSPNVCNDSITDFNEDVYKRQVLTNVHSVGVMGDARTYDSLIALRAVTTDDFMTADWARIPFDAVSYTHLDVYKRQSMHLVWCGDSTHRCRASGTI